MPYDLVHSEGRGLERTPACTDQGSSIESSKHATSSGDWVSLFELLPDISEWKAREKLSIAKQKPMDCLNETYQSIKKIMHVVVRCSGRE